MTTRTNGLDVVDVRNEDDPALPGQNVNLAYDALGATLEFYREVLGRNSIDNLGLNLDANVNYRRFRQCILGWYSDGIRQRRRQHLSGLHQRR